MSTNTSLPTKESSSSREGTSSIKLVIQRYRKANVLIDESKVVTVGVGNDDDKSSSSSSSLLMSPSASPSSSPSVGLLAYISFSKTSTNQHVEQAATTLLNLQVLTLGGWGDGTSTQSILELASEKQQAIIKKEDGDIYNLSIVLIPQADLICKVKRNGKSIQYHDQISKTKGEELYKLFVDQVRTQLIEHQTNSQQNKKTSATNNKPGTPDPSIPPEDLFRLHFDNAYGSFDENGFPLTTKSSDNGEEEYIPLSKSAKKKLTKIYDAHIKRHEKFLKEGGNASTEKNTVSQEVAKREGDIGEHKEEQQENSINKLVTIVAGSFGKRQGIEIYSDMGPFCHIVEI